jgi:hypothetical protein
MVAADADGNLTDCPVASEAGGVDVPLDTLLDIAERRVYDASR